MRLPKKEKNKHAFQQSALAEAIKNIELEISKINEERKRLSENMESASSGIAKSRKTEEALQEKIARLMTEEARLSEERKKLQTKLDALSEKMSKMTKIKAEMDAL